MVILQVLWEKTCIQVKTRSFSVSTHDPKMKASSKTPGLQPHKTTPEHWNHWPR